MQIGFTSLLVASQNGHYEVAALLIEKGAEVDCASKVNSMTCFIIRECVLCCLACAIPILNSVGKKSTVSRYVTNHSQNLSVFMPAGYIMRFKNSI